VADDERAWLGNQEVWRPTLDPAWFVCCQYATEAFDERFQRWPMSMLSRLSQRKLLLQRFQIFLRWLLHEDESLTH